MAKETYYFQHDYNARNDEKTAALIADHGCTGYGVYWVVAEMLHEDNGSSIEYTEKKLRRIAGTVKTDFDTFNQIIKDCIEIYELFEVRHGYLTSGRVVRNKERVIAIKEKRRAAGKKGAASTNSKKASSDVELSANVRQMPTQTPANADVNGGKCRANAEQMPSNAAAKVDKGKEIKGKEIKGKENKDIGEGEKISPPAPSKEDLLKQKQAAFYQSLVDHVPEYGKDMIRSFYDYWSEPTKSRTKQKWENESTWELKRRLDRWRERDDRWQRPSNQQQPQTNSIANRKL